MSLVVDSDLPMAEVIDMTDSPVSRRRCCDCLDSGTGAEDDRDEAHEAVDRGMGGTYRGGPPLLDLQHG